MAISEHVENAGIENAVHHLIEVINSNNFMILRRCSFRRCVYHASATDFKYGNPRGHFHGDRKNCQYVEDIWPIQHPVSLQCLLVYYLTIPFLLWLSCRMNT